jgi:hypothetical protein
VVFPKGLEDHFQHLEKVLKVIRAEGIHLKMSKCSFFTEEMEYLGHLISQDGIKKDPKKLKAIEKVQTPTN